VRDEISKKVQALHPDATEHDIDMYLDVMGMDQEKFLYYGEKLGMTDLKESMDAYFSENSAVEKDVMRRRYAMEDKATFSCRGNPTLLHAVDEKWDPLYELRGSAGENALELEDRFGVRIADQVGVSEELAHKHTSYLLNLADAHPAIGTILSERVKILRYKARYPGETASASWDEFDHAITVKDFDYPLGPATFAHEIGHAAEDYVGNLPGLVEMGFGQGRTASSYGWKNHHEDWAEWFTGALEPIPGFAEWDPAKFEKVRNLITALGG